TPRAPARQAPWPRPGFVTTDPPLDLAEALAQDPGLHLQSLKPSPELPQAAGKRRQLLVPEPAPRRPAPVPGPQAVVSLEPFLGVLGDLVEGLAQILGCFQVRPTGGPATPDFPADLLCELPR